MNRRHFLALLSASVVGASLPRWSPGARPEFPAFALTTQWVARETLAELRRLGVGGTLSPRMTKLAQVGDQQLHIDLLWATPGQEREWGAWEWRDRVLRPAARQLAALAKRKGLRTFGVLPVPPSVADVAVVTHAESGLSVRCVRNYDSEWDRFVTRVDILGRP